MDLLNSKIEKYSKKINTSNQDKKQLYSNKLNNYIQARHELQKYIEKGGSIEDFPAIMKSSNSLSDKSKEILSGLKNQTVEGYSKESVDNLFANLKNKIDEFNDSKQKKSDDVANLISDLYKNIFILHKEISQLDGFKHNVNNINGDFGNLNFDILSLIKEQVTTSIQEYFITELNKIGSEISDDENEVLSDLEKKEINIYIEQIKNLNESEKFDFISKINNITNKKIVKYFESELNIPKIKSNPEEEKELTPPILPENEDNKNNEDNNKIKKD